MVLHFKEHREVWTTNICHTTPTEKNRGKWMHPCCLLLASASSILTQTKAQEMILCCTCLGWVFPSQLTITQNHIEMHTSQVNYTMSPAFLKWLYVVISWELELTTTDSDVISDYICVINISCNTEAINENERFCIYIYLSCPKEQTIIFFIIQSECTKIEDTDKSHNVWSFIIIYHQIEILHL